MIKGRKEIAPAEQLSGLRSAYGRYKALADQIRDETDFPGTEEEKQEREREARRIAHAYEKSIANMVTSCRVNHVDLDRTISGSARMRFAIFACLVAVAAGATLYVLSNPALPKIRIVVEPAGNSDRRATVAAENSRGGIARIGETPAIVQAPAPGPMTRRADNPHPKPRAAARKIAPLPSPVVARKVNSAKDEGGFVVKVLQPDGSLQEKYFKPAASR
jgi:hypothetical protein